VTWFKVDDGFWSHPKTLQLTPSAVALWVRAGAWSCQHLTDGFVPSYALNLFGFDEHSAVELVEVEYWHEAQGGYEFHDWEDYQESSGKVKERRAKNAEKLRKWREKQGSNDGGNPVADEVTNPVSNPAPDPTRPDPTNKPSSTKKVGASRRKPETPMPDDWTPKPAHVKYAADRGVDGRHEEGQFRAWCASKDMRYRDWDAAFRNWLGRANPSKVTPTQKAQRTVMLATELMEIEQ
jgi:hypothetical protein